MPSPTLRRGNPAPKPPAVHRYRSPWPLGSRIDYTVRTVVRAIEDTPDGAAFELECTGGTLTFRRRGEALTLAAPGRPQQVLEPAALPALVFDAIADHARARASGAALAAGRASDASAA